MWACRSQLVVCTCTAAAPIGRPAVVLSFLVAGISALLSALCYSEFAAEVRSREGQLCVGPRRMAPLQGHRSMPVWPPVVCHGSIACVGKLFSRGLQPAVVAAHNSRRRCCHGKLGNAAWLC
jgi:hypothetical protein